MKKTCVVVLVSPTHLPFLFACLHVLVSCVYVSCSYIHRRPVLMPTLVIQKNELNNDIYVWIHWNSIETWLLVFLVCLCVCVCKCLLHNNRRMYTSNQYSYVWGPLRECHSIQSGASGLPYYCTPRVRISVVIGLLTAWWRNKQETKKPHT